MLIIFNSIVIMLLFREELPPTDFMVNSRMSSAQIVSKSNTEDMEKGGGGNNASVEGKSHTESVSYIWS